MRINEQNTTARPIESGVEERMRSVVHHVVDGVISINDRGTVTTFNPAAERIFGYTAAEVIDQNVKILMPEPFYSEHDGHIDDFLRTGLAKIVGVGREVMGRRKDGSIFPMDLAVSVFRLGEARYFTGIFRDITERKRAEAELRDAKERMRSIVDHVIDGIITIDARGTVESLNPAAQRLFGYSAPEVIGQNVKRLMPEPYYSEHDGYIGNYLRSGQAKIIGIGREVVGRRKDGSTFPMDLAVSEFQLGQNRYFTGIVRDITERKRAAELLQERAALASLSGEIGLAFTRGGTLREMLQRCAESMVKNLGGAFARIWTLNRPDNVLELQASAGMYTHLDGSHSRVPLGAFKIGLIAAERTPHLTNDVASDPRISDPEWAQREGMVAFAGYPLLLEDRVVGVVGMFARHPLTDTTLHAIASVANQIALGVERKVREEALRNSEERFQELTAHIRQILWVIDARESKLIYVSRAYETIWGRSCQSLLDHPQSYMQGVHPQDREMMIRENAAMYQTGHIDVGFRVLRPDGSERWVWIQGYPVREQGQIVRVVGIIEDITEKRRLAAERDILLSRLQLHIKRMPLAYVLFDADFRICDWNQAAERIFGYAKHEMLGVGPPYEPFIPRSFWLEGEEIRRRIRSGDMEAHSTNENLTKDGRTITCQWFNTPLLDNHGQFLGFLCLAQDITEANRTKEALTLFRALLDRTNDAVEVVDPENGRFLDVNEKACLTHGYTREEYLELSVADLDPKVARRPWRETAEEMRQAGFRIVESSHRRKDGSSFPAEININYIRLNRDYILATVRDVTDRKRRERRLSAQHAVTRVLADSPSLQEASVRILQALCEGLEWQLGGLWTVDRSAQVLRCMQTWHQPSEPLAEFVAANKRLTFPPGIGLPGRIWANRQAQWIPDIAADATFTRRALAVQSGLRCGFGFPITLGNDILGVLDFFSLDVKQPDEDILTMMSTVGSQIGQFIERKQAEELLRDSNQNLQTLIQAAPLAIITLDPDGVVQAWNPAAERIFGWNAEEVIGRFIPYIPGEKQGEFYSLMRQVSEGNDLVGFETQRIRKNGSRVDIRMSITPLRDVGGAVIGFLGLIDDITGHKQLEAQFQQAQKMEAVGRLAGGVAHDFNNLLTVIGGFSEMILATVRPADPLHAMAEQIHAAGQRAARLTRQLLAFSRKQILVPSVLNLNAVLTDMQKMLPRLIGEDIEISVRLASDLWPVHADPGQIEQVVMNLVVNARDAMPRGGKLTIETDNVELDQNYLENHPHVVAGSFVRLAISDTGCGMDASTKQRIFEPFFTTKGAEQGTGLGLATVFGIVKQSGGMIDVYSELGIGSTFKIYFPRDQQNAPTAPSSSKPTAATRGNETILLVEDDDGVRLLAQSILRSAGYTVLPASNGGEAILLSEQHQGPIQLMVTDVVMPKMSGRELATRLAPMRPEMKTLFLSGYTDDAVLRHGILAEKMPFLQKPFKTEVLPQKVREVLDSPTAASNESSKFPNS